MVKISFVLIIMSMVISLHAQSQSAFGTDESSGTGLLDPSRLTINHSVSFGMGGSEISNLQSQSLYSTMLRYQFNAPISLSLNFGLPIHSTFNSTHNITEDNIQSLEYFRNIPINASVAWQPNENFSLRFIINRTPDYNYYNSMLPGTNQFNQTFNARYRPYTPKPWMY
ncbi:hypothetical protein CHISP_0526 [Chitinispirillum alkaliphilum]|nr:hypothetical protein CHISP_0526 [Chitinispirillum alkaliphilum]